MIRLKVEHIDAIVHAERALDSQLLQPSSPQLRAAIDDDLLRIAEVKIFLIQRLVKTQGQFNMNGSS